MAYIVNKTDGTVFLIVQDSQIASTAGITVIGKNYAGYGEIINENFVRILENFSGSTPPSNPITGQLWWDTVNTQMKVYNSTNWSIPIGATGPIGYTGSSGYVGSQGIEGPTGPIGPSGVSSFPLDAIGQLTNDGSGNFSWVDILSNVSINNDTILSTVTGNINIGEYGEENNLNVVGNLTVTNNINVNKLNSLDFESNSAALVNLSVSNTANIETLFSSNANIGNLVASSISANNVASLVTVENIPLTSIGSAGDRYGFIAADDAYLYFCIADYDGVTAIWKRLFWPVEEW